MDTKKGFLIIGIILIIVSAISCIFGYRIRELWPSSIKIFESGIPYIIGALGVIFLVIFLGVNAIFLVLSAKKKIDK